jgi:Ca2+-transporting ATPase
MAFGVVALSAVNLGLTMRRKLQPAWAGPMFPYLGWIMLGWFLTWTAIELPMFQRALDTTPLTGAQWALIIGLSLIAPVLVEIDKAIIRRHQSQPATA